MMRRFNIYFNPAFGLAPVSISLDAITWEGVGRDLGLMQIIHVTVCKY